MNGSINDEAYVNAYSPNNYVFDMDSFIESWKSSDKAMIGEHRSKGDSKYFANFYEYTFCCIANDINKKRLQDGKPELSFEDLIKIHDDAAFLSANVSMGNDSDEICGFNNLSRRDFGHIMNYVFYDVNDMKPIFGESDLHTSLLFNSFFNEAYNSYDKAVQERNYAVSVFDKRFSQRDIFARTAETKLDSNKNKFLAFGRLTDDKTTFTFTNEYNDSSVILNLRDLTIDWRDANVDKSVANINTQTSDELSAAPSVENTPVPTISFDNVAISDAEAAEVTNSSERASETVDVTKDTSNTVSEPVSVQPTLDANFKTSFQKRNSFSYLPPKTKFRYKNDVGKYVIDANNAFFVAEQSVYDATFNRAVSMLNSRRKTAGLSPISLNEVEACRKGVSDNVSNRFALSNGQHINITQLDGGAYRRVLNHVFDPFLPETNGKKKQPLFHSMGSTDFESDPKIIRNNELFYEFYFNKVTGELNKKRISEDKSAILISRLNDLHDKVFERFDNSNNLFSITKDSNSNIIDSKPIKSCGQVNHKLFRIEANRVFERELGEKPFSDEGFFDECTKIFNEVQSNEHYLPLSAFDKKYRKKDSFKRFGDRVLWATDDSFHIIYGNPKDEASTTMLNDIRVSEIDDENGSHLIFTPSERPIEFETVNDRTGISRLANYIPQKDYNKLSEWVSSGVVDMSNSESPYLQCMSDEDLDVSVSILEYLQDNGYDFEIKPDRKRGQLCAELKNYGMSIRIMDSLQNSQHIGRVHSNGWNFYYSVDNSGKAPEPETVRAELRQTMKSLKEHDGTNGYVDLIKYVMGQPVKGERHTRNSDGVHHDEMLVGSPVRYKQGNNFRESAVYKPKESASKPATISVEYANLDPVSGNRYSGSNINFRQIKIHGANTYNESDTVFDDTDNKASDFIKKAISSATSNFKEAINLDYLISEAEAHYDDDDYTPEFSGDEEIASLQQTYYDVLSYKTNVLYKFGVTDEMYNNSASDAERNNMVYQGNEIKMVKEHLDSYCMHSFGHYSIDNEVEMQAVNDKYPDLNGKLFNPFKVAKYMTGKSRLSNRDILINAVRAEGLSSDDLMGSDYDTTVLKNKLIKFDIDNCHPMKYDADNEFLSSVYKTIKSTIESSGCTVNEDDILLDNQGIVQYKCTKTTAGAGRGSTTSQTQEVTGYLGQIFIPDKDGAVKTNFAGGDNYVFVPGYNAYIVPQKIGENKSFEERTRLKGYKQEMNRAIAYQLRTDLRKSSNIVGEPTNVNNIHHKMYDMRFEIEDYNTLKEKPYFKSIVSTLSRRIRYSNEYRDNATINADYNAKKQLSNTFGFAAERAISNYINDNFRSAYNLCGKRNMNILRDENDSGRNIFDMWATATGVNQGIVRYLCEHTHVDDDGKIILDDDIERNDKGDIAFVDENGNKSFRPDKTPLMDIPQLRYLLNMPFDRKQMVFGNCLTARDIVDDVHMAQMTFGGWTFDDGYVVSKEFAEAHPIKGENGEYRPLTIGDKICDFGGNKGVISLVVDRNMDMYEAAEKQITKPVEWFKANPTLDVVGAPFPAVSRFNASSDKILMENPSDLYSPDGKKLEGCMGSTSFIITDMPVDVKTHAYNDEDVAAGKGRKMSSQGTWVLSAYGAKNIMRESFSSNSGSFANLREYLLAVGLDIDSKGQFKNEFDANSLENESRLRFKILSKGEAVRDENGKLEKGIIEINPVLKFNSKSVSCIDSENPGTQLKDKFSSQIAESGGVIELPFELNFPKADNEDEFIRKTPVISEVNGVSTFGLPVLSSHLRSGQEIEDGTAIAHDYTEKYLTVYENAALYKRDNELLKICNAIIYKSKSTDASVDMSTKTVSINFGSDEGTYLSKHVMAGVGVDENDFWKQNDDGTFSMRVSSDFFAESNPKSIYGLQKRLASNLKSYQTNAQYAYNGIANDLVERKLNRDKKNVFKNEILSNRLPNSATAVWTADPRLPINTVAVSPELAKTLKINVEDKENFGDEIVLWRDPLLKKSGMQNFKVVVNEDLVGAAINPAVDNLFDGDFDGDSVALVNFRTPAAKREAHNLLSLENSLLTFASVKDDGSYGLYTQNGLDLASAQYFDEISKTNGEATFRERRAEIERKANEANLLDETSFVDRKHKQEVNGQILRELDTWTRETFDSAYGDMIISYKDEKEHLKSLETIVKSGAKGNYSKLLEHLHYMDLDVDMVKNDEGEISGIDYDSLRPYTETFKNQILESNPQMEDEIAEKMAVTMLDEHNHQCDTDVMTATAIKAGGTGVAGKYSQRGIKVFRIAAPDVILEITYPNTQGIVQAKHDAADAINRYDILMSAAKDLWKGRKLESYNDDKNNISWKPVRERDENGKWNFVQATPEEFKKQFFEIYGKKGLNCDVNPSYVDVIANVLNDGSIDSPKMVDIESDGILNLPNTSVNVIDDLAYNNNKGFSALVNACNNGWNLFETTKGEKNTIMVNAAPNNVRQNIVALQKDGADAEIKAINKSDIKRSKEVTVQKRYSNDNAIGRTVLPDLSTMPHVQFAATKASASVQQSNQFVQNLNLNSAASTEPSFG